MLQSNREAAGVVKTGSISDEVPKLYLLGHPRLIDAQGKRVEMTSKKAIAVLGLLALSNDGIRSRAWLQQKLWGSRDTKQAQNSLRRELSNMRKTLPCVPLISDHRSVRINLDRIWIDVRDDPKAVSSSDEDFLEGLDIAGEEDFEEWLRDARSQITADDAGEDISDDEDEGDSPPAAPAPRAAFPAAPRSDVQAADAWQPPSIMVAAHFDPGMRREDAGILQLFAQEMNAGLARLGWLRVIAPPSPSGIAGLEGASSGARYCLSLSLLPASTPILSMSCIELPPRTIIWSESGAVAFPLQQKDLNLRVGRTVNALENAIAGSGQIMEAGADPASLGHSLQCLRALLRRIFSAADIGLADKLLIGLRASEDRPELDIFGAIHALRCYWWKRRNGAMNEARRLGEIALARNHGDPRPLLVLGVLQKWSGNFATAMHLFERAIASNPACAAAYANLGAVHLLCGEPERAMPMLKAAEALSPFDPELFWIYGQMATSAYIAGEYDEALRHAANSLSLQSRYTLPALISMNCHLAKGNREMAANAREHPGLANSRTIEHALALMPFDNARHSEMLRAGIGELSAPGIA